MKLLSHRVISRTAVISWLGAGLWAHGWAGLPSSRADEPGTAPTLSPPASASPAVAVQPISLVAAAVGQQATTDNDNENGDVQIPEDRLVHHVPDPYFDWQRAERLLAEAQQANDRPTITYINRLFERLEVIRRPRSVHLTLEQALQRALAHNYSIQVQSYNPAIDTTRVVEAEAAFDAVFFTNLTRNKQDRPTGSQLAAGDLDFVQWRSGISQFLPTGATVSASYGLQRTKTALRFQQINPEYFSDIQLEIRQPILRGFGLDVNRTLILVHRNNRRISHYAFTRQVRDTLRNVEELYWRLVEARRDVVVTARLLADYEQIYDYLVARQAFDVTPVQLSATKANLEQSRAQFIRVRASVFNAEDQLIAAMNDPELALTSSIEIIPDDFPILKRFTVDAIGEVQTALDHRPEIQEQQLRIANARIAAAQARNDELPRFDVLFRYTINGLAGNADKSFDEVTRNKYEDYLIGVEFEVPIGNRGPRAAHRRAELQHQQAMAQLRAVFEEVILDVNLSIRQMSTSYDQIAPGFESSEAREREVESIVARAERKDINTLNSELGARQSLATSRRTMLRAMIDYNIAIIDLERAKGTLLRHHNVIVPEYPD